MMPSVPSEPTNSWVRSGPTAARGSRRCGSAGRRRGRRRGRRPCPRSSRSGCSSARRRGTRASRRRWRGRSTGASGRASTPCSARSVSSSQVPNVPGSTSRIIDSRSTPTIPLSAVRSRTTPPCTGTLAPHTPLRPAAGGDRDAAPRCRARAPRRPRPASPAGRPPRRAPAIWPSSDHTVVSGHQSRLASTHVASASTSTVAPRRRACGAARRRRSTRVAVEPARGLVGRACSSAIGGVGAPRVKARSSARSIRSSAGRLGASPRQAMRRERSAMSGAEPGAVRSSSSAAR